MNIELEPSTMVYFCEVTYPNNLIYTKNMLS